VIRAGVRNKHASESIASHVAATRARCVPVNSRCDVVTSGPIRKQYGKIHGVHRSIAIEIGDVASDAKVRKQHAEIRSTDMSVAINVSKDIAF
jgi:hypothetical protein